MPEAPLPRHPDPTAPPLDPRPRARDGLRALAETAIAACAYIAISLAAVRYLDLSMLFSDSWSAAERKVGSGFLVGATTQLLLVLAGAYLLRSIDLRRAIGRTFAPAPLKAWSIAFAATMIHLGTVLFVVLPQPQRVAEASSLNLLLSLIPAADGWSQEMFFRGYVLFRLARANIPGLAQILFSGLLFAAIHIGYAGHGWAAVSPLLGTFILGSFYAWAVRSGRGSLLPAVLGHILIVAVAQPWLALAR